MMALTENFGAPVLAVCGFSGSGKTTLLESAIPHLVARGLSVAVVKHDSHGFMVDQEGKDSDRLFRAGATVALRGPGEQFFRRNASSAVSLQTTLSDLARDHDFLLIEGHKDTPIPKLWVSSADATVQPAHVSSVQGVLPWNSDRLTTFLNFVDRWLPNEWKARSLFAGLLVGGKSSRMGRPKQLANFCGTTLGEIGVQALSDAIDGCASDSDSLSSRVFILGAGQIADSLRHLIRIPDAPALAGPVAGLIAAHRWAPEAAWILAACDHPWLSPADIQWLIQQRRPGTWAIFPRQPDGHPCPTVALFEPQALAVLERSLLVRGAEKLRIAELFNHPRTLIANGLTHALTNVNTPQELAVQAAIAEATRSSFSYRKHREQRSSAEFDCAAKICGEYCIGEAMESND
jgi:molybdopterin-guanine dinucleotide biosynthesis protein A